LLLRTVKSPFDQLLEVSVYAGYIFLRGVFVRAQPINIPTMEDFTLDTSPHGLNHRGTLGAGH
jgi:hypothetical protein